MEIKKTERPLLQISFYLDDKELGDMFPVFEWLEAYRTNEILAAFSFLLWVPPFEHFEDFFKAHFKCPTSDAPELIVQKLKERALETINQEDQGFVKFLFFKK